MTQNDESLLNFASIAGLMLAVVITVGAYYGITGRLDRIDDRLAGQIKTIETVIGSIESLAKRMR